MLKLRFFRTMYWIRNTSFIAWYFLIPIIHETLYWLRSAHFFSAPLWNLDCNLLSDFNYSLNSWFLAWNTNIKRNLVHSMSWERCVAVRTQEVTFDSQLKSHTGEPFNFQATSLNCLCCCSSTFIVRTWLNRAGEAWRASGGPSIFGHNRIKAYI